MNNSELYKKWFIEKQFERSDLFFQLTEKYKVQSCLYPGSFIHITPSFYIKTVFYVDSDSNAKKFFADETGVKKLINARKTYKQDSKFRFFGQDYFKPIDIEEGSIDLLVSQWAGPISKACKKYLKIGGHLLVNNSHADAGIAALDGNYLLVGAVKSAEKGCGISEEILDQYFQAKKERVTTIESLLESEKGIAHKKIASYYVFEKLS